MGILGLFGEVQDDRHTVASGRVKGPCATLRDHGIDPAGLKFTLNHDGSVTVSGRVRDASECASICRIIEGMTLVEGVRNDMVVEDGGETRFAGKVRLAG